MVHANIVIQIIFSTLITMCVKNSHILTHIVKLKMTKVYASNVMTIKLQLMMLTSVCPKYPTVKSTFHLKNASNVQIRKLKYPMTSAAMKSLTARGMMPNVHAPKLAKMDTLKMITKCVWQKQTIVRIKKTMVIASTVNRDNKCQWMINKHVWSKSTTAKVNWAVEIVRSVYMAMN